jgi:hypothetical protein
MKLWTIAAAVCVSFPASSAAPELIVQSGHSSAAWVKSIAPCSPV